MYQYELLHRMYPSEINHLLSEAKLLRNFEPQLLNEANEMLFLDSCGGSAERMVLETSNNGRVIFRGKFQEANAVNKNKRMYTFEVLKANVDRLNETMNENGLYGELDHPTDSIIHLEKASHVIKKLWFDGNVLMGEAEILPTPSGRILQNLIEFGGRVGISSRGVGNGSVNNEGVLVIGESYRLITFDAVADPSTFAAYQKVIANNQREEIAPNVVIKDNPYEDRKSSYKNESTGINTLNSNILVAYVDHLSKSHIQRIKQEKF